MKNRTRLSYCIIKNDLRLPSSTCYCLERLYVPHRSFFFTYQVEEAHRLFGSKIKVDISDLQGLRKEHGLFTSKIIHTDRLHTVFCLKHCFFLDQKSQIFILSSTTFQTTNKSILLPPSKLVWSVESALPHLNFFSVRHTPLSNGHYPGAAFAHPGYTLPGWVLAGTQHIIFHFPSDIHGDVSRQRISRTNGPPFA